MKNTWVGSKGVAGVSLLLAVMATQAMAQQSPAPGNEKVPAPEIKLIPVPTTQQAGAGGWQQTYCEAQPKTPQGPLQCINKCTAGTYPVMPTLTPQLPGQSGGEPNCRCLADGTTLPTTVAPSLVHIHSVTTQQGTTIVDGSSATNPVVTVGQQITLTGCNFGNSGIVEEQTPNNGGFQIALPTPTGANWSSTTVKMEVSPNIAANLYGNGSYGGVIELQAPGGLSNQVYLNVNCPTPTISGIGPTGVQPGGSVTFTGCGFGATPGEVLLSVPGTTVSTMNGPNPEAYQILPGSGWGGTSVTFQVPANATPGTYNFSAGVPASSAANTTYTMAAWNSSSPITIQVLAPPTQTAPPSTAPTFGIFNPQASPTFTPSQVGTGYYSTPFVSLWPRLPSQNSGLTTTNQSTVEGVSPAAPWIWASMGTQVSIPVQVENYQGSGINVQLEIWQDTAGTPQCDQSGPADFSPDGNKGSWGNLGDPQAIPAGTTETIYIPVTLNPGINYLALGGLYGNLKTYRNAGTFTCPSGNGPVPYITTGGSVYPNNMIGQWVQPIFVLPVYTVTLDALPYTILYQPPGDQSKSVVVDTIASSIQYKIGEGIKKSNDSNDATKTCVSADIALAGIGPSINSCQQYSNETQNDFSQQWTSSETITDTSTDTYNVGPVTSLVPAPPSSSSTYNSWGATYDNEPFWYDEYVFLMNPVYAVYNNNGVADFRLLPTYQPTFSGPVPLASLAACAAGLPSPTGIGFSPSGNPCVFDTPTGSITLTPSEAVSALSLDPFYPNGQSQDPTGGCAASATVACRVIPNPKGNQGYREDQPPVLVSFQVGQQQTAQYDITNTYTATATSVQDTTLGFKGNLSQAIGQTDGMGGLTASGTIGMSSESTSTQKSVVAINYTASTIATTTQTNLDTVTLADDDASSTISGISCKASTTPCHATLNPPSNGFSPLAYWDSMFGTLLFRDPYAPGPPPGNYTDQLRRLLPGILKRMPPSLQPAALKPMQKTGAN